MDNNPTLINEAPPLQPQFVSKHFHLPRVLLVLLVALISAGLFGTIGYFLGMGKQTIEPTKISENNSTYRKDSSTSPTLSQMLPSPTSRLKQTDETTNWTVYTNTKYSYTFKHPDTFSLSNSLNSNVSENEISVLVLPYTADFQGAPSLPIFYVDVLPNGISLNGTYNKDGITEGIKNYLLSNVGDKVSPPNQAWGETYNRLTDITIDGFKAAVFEGNINGSTDRRIFVQKTGWIYEIGTYYNNSADTNINKFTNLLSTFKFTK